MKAKFLPLIALAAALGFSAPASAQLSDTGGPISYSADNLEYTDGNRTLVLTGDVDIVQRDARLRATRVTLYFAAGGGGQSGLSSGDIQRMVAEGDVYYVRPTQQARGDRAVYETAADTVTFTGNVVVAGEDNVIRGETLVLNIKGGTTQIRPGGGQRVQGVFRPRGSSGTAAQ
ncbi:MAG: LptA/OstA family protein [Caulobacterales bacterium]